MNVTAASLSDAESLFLFLNALSSETRARFGPHPFDYKTVSQVCSGLFEGYLGFLCLDQSKVVGYLVAKPGYLHWEIQRFKNYGLPLNESIVFTIAPCVADNYQSKGIGGILLSFVIEALKPKGAKKLVLWGGVQSSNINAIKYYKKHGFVELGQFEHNGLNLDMVLNLD